ncbi:MAG: bifunctional 4-hydroxy-3-methylbut-2-enyl diphosphate reductase/30S ribosomal protein S1 [Lachnospirales bacterium]
MEIIVAENAGFCFGVEMALKKTYEEVNKYKLSTYGPIIHNKFVTSDLEKKGVDIVENLNDFNKDKLVIRSHGVPKEVYINAENKGINLLDVTCVYVKKIHKIVEDAYNKNKKIIILGNPTHPEVIGINGWAENSCIIISSVEEANNLPIEKEKYLIVSQTTFNINTFQQIKEVLVKRIANIEIIDTICRATTSRQKKAEELSKNVDFMLVLGDKKSSNTNKLYEICKKNCLNTILIESINELELNILPKDGKIGITAGASTPLAIIKEAISVMSDKSFEELLNEQELVQLHTGSIVEGEVLEISNNEVTVSFGYKADGIIPRNEIAEDPSLSPEDVVSIGDKIEVYIVQLNDGEGNVKLSKKRVDSQKHLNALEEYYTNQTVVKGKIVELVKSGAIALINDARVFVPASQISNRFVSDLTPFKGKEYDFKIIEFDKAKRRIVASRKELAIAEENAKREAVFKKLEVGQKIEGTVSRIANFGAFIDLGGIDGLIHISEISWGRVKKVEDVLKVGDVVNAIVLNLDLEKGKISLSLKDPESNPWKIAEETYAIGNIVEGKVVRMVTFGAFIELEPGIDGLVHISQISEKHIAKPEEVLSQGEIIQAKVTDFDSENKKISLSIRALDANEEESDAEEVSEEEAE